LPVDSDPGVIEAVGQPRSVAAAAFGEIVPLVKAASQLPRWQCCLLVGEGILPVGMRGLCRCPCGAFSAYYRCQGRLLACGGHDRFSHAVIVVIPAAGMVTAGDCLRTPGGVFPVLRRGFWRAGLGVRGGSGDSGCGED
jgi:hypothetical protein